MKIHKFLGKQLENLHGNRRSLASRIYDLEMDRDSEANGHVNDGLALSRMRHELRRRFRLVLHHVGAYDAHYYYRKA